MEKLKQWIDRMPILSGLSVYIDLIERHQATNPNVALDAAKSLLESLAKTILTDRGISFEHDSGVKFLVKEAVRTAKVMENISGTDSLQRIVQGFDTIANAIGTLRNRHGLISHGQDIVSCQIDHISVEFVVEAMLTTVHFLLALHSKENCVKKRIFYEENPDFNRYIDSVNEQSGMDFSVFEISITPSKALFYEDLEAYRERLIMFRSEKEEIFTALQNCFSLEKFEEAMQFRDCFTADEYDTIREIFYHNESHFLECESCDYKEYFSKRIIAEEAN